MFDTIINLSLIHIFPYYCLISAGAKTHIGGTICHGALVKSIISLSSSPGSALITNIQMFGKDISFFFARS